MKKYLILIALFFVSFTFYAQNADDILGTWITEGGKSLVKVTKQDNKYYGKIIWLREPKEKDGTIKLDKNNPDKNLQKKPIVGLQILKDFVFTDDKTWENGTIYDPENGKTYSCTIKIIGKNQLDVRGYIGISLIGRTTTWYRKLKK